MLSVDGCLTRAMAIPGARSATLVDGATGLAIAAVGREDVLDQHELAAGTTDVVREVLGSPAFVTTETGDDVEEIIVCCTGGYHLLTLVDVDVDGQLFIHLLIDRDTGNLGLARLRIQALAREITGREHAR